MINVFITDLEKYNNGQLVGEWVELPMDEDELKEKIEEILDGNEEYFITDSECDIEYKVGEYENVFELNENLKEIEKINDNDLVTAILRSTSNDLEEVESIIRQGRCLYFKGVTDEEELGEMIIAEGLFGIEVPDNLAKYLDYKKIGEDWDMTIYEDLKIAISTQ